MPIIGIDRHHHGVLPGALGRQHSLRREERSLINPHTALHPAHPRYHREAPVHGGLDLSACHGRYHTDIEAALGVIAKARLPGGGPPQLTKDLETVRGHPTVVTYIEYGLLRWAQPTTAEYDDDHRLIGVVIRLTAMAFWGTSAKSAHPATKHHAAFAPQPALPALFSDGSPRLLETSLAHEIGHAARIIGHRTLEVWETDEVIVTELENQYRYARHILQRKGYGDIPVKQYPW